MSGIKSSNDQNLHDPESHDPEIWYGSDIIWIPDLNDQNVDDPNDRLSLHDWFDNSVGLERATDTNSNENRRNTVEEQTAVGLTLVVMQGMPLDGDFDEPDNAAMTQAISTCLIRPSDQL